MVGPTYPGIKDQSTPDAFATQNKEDQGRETYKKAPHPAHYINAPSYQILPLLRQKQIQIAKTKEDIHSQIKREDSYQNLEEIIAAYC